MRAFKPVFLAALLALPISAGADSLREEAAHGTTDWHAGYIEATGQGTARYMGNRIQEELMAKEAARMSAQARLLGQIEGVRLTGLATLGQSAQNNTRAATRIKGTLKGAKVVSETVSWHPDETARRKAVPLAEVTLRVCLMPGCASNDASFVSPLPETSEAPAYDPEQTDHSALILDLNQALYLPTLAPEILTESGETVYSHQHVETQTARTKGLIHYTRSLDEAHALDISGASPLVVPIVKVNEANQLIISDADAARFKNAAFLGQGRVIVALD